MCMKLFIFIFGYIHWYDYNSNMRVLHESEEMTQMGEKTTNAREMIFEQFYTFG